MANHLLEEPYVLLLFACSVLLLQVLSPQTSDGFFSIWLSITLLTTWLYQSDFFSASVLDGNLSTNLPRQEVMDTESPSSGLEPPTGFQLLLSVSMHTSVSNKIRTSALLSWFLLLSCHASCHSRFPVWTPLHGSKRSSCVESASFQWALPACPDQHPRLDWCGWPPSRFTSVFASSLLTQQFSLTCFSNSLPVI